MNIDQANRIPLPEILARLDLHPKRLSGNKALYSSPLRKEKTPSFWVNLNSNSWYDYGAGIGGNVVNFVSHYLRSTREDHNVTDALRWIRNMAGQEIITPPVGLYKSRDENSPLSIRSAEPIRHIALIRYLEKRRIALDVAHAHLKEVIIDNNVTGKSFFALGFKNEDGGYELRNPFFKGSTSPKTITFIRGKAYPAERIHLLEGFMDYLSVVTRFGYSYLAGDSIVLNSVSSLPKAFPFIKDYSYKAVCSWMDNDKAGDNTSRLLSEFINTQKDMRYVRMNKMYTPHKDVNEWHVSTLQEVRYER